MIFSVSEAQKCPGEVFPIALTEALEPETYAGNPVMFTAPADITGSFSFDGKAFHVEAKATVSYETACARCTKPFIETLTFSIDEHFVRDTVWDEEQDAYPYTREQIDLSQAFFDNLFLNFPLVSLCKPDCLGLCPICGADRNVNPCACQTEIGSGKFSALQQLLNENKEV